MKQIINMYRPSMVIPFAVSLFVFFLYMMLQVIDMNSFVKGMDILDASKSNRASLVFGYLVGYITFFFKLVLQLLTLVVLLTIIFWIIVGMTSMLKDSQSGGGNYASVRELRGGEGGDVGEKMKKVAIKVVTYLMGVFFVKNFMIVFLFIVPVFILFFTIMYVQFYNRDIMRKKDKEKEALIMGTNHNFMMMVITAIIVFSLVMVSIYYLIDIIKLPPGSEGEGDGDSGDAKD